MSPMQSKTLPLSARDLPPAGTVELWLTDLDALPLDAGPDGLDRKQRMLRRRLQQQFVLRLLLGAYLGCAGKSVRLIRTDRGKPVLGGTHAGALCFNLSHSANWLAVAVGCDGEIGVDIETERRMARARDLAGRFFPAEEARWLEHQDEPFLSRQFLIQWTAREALVKATGSGLAGSLGCIELAWQPPAIRALPAEWPGAEQWSLLPVPAIDGVVGHVAVDRPDVKLESFHLNTRVSDSG